MRTLYLLRHGETDANKNQVWSSHKDPLNETGQNQAKIAAAKIKTEGLKFDLIITSTQPRAIETAEYIADAVSYPQKYIIHNPSTVERKCGILDGTVNKQASMEHKIAENLIDKYSGVESMTDLQLRANVFWEYLKSLNQNTILVVGHGAFMRAVLRNINGNPITERGQIFANCELIKIDNAAYEK